MSGEISRPRRSAPRDLNPGGAPLRDEWVETRVGADEVLRGGERRRDVLTFSVADEEYALGIESIREIIKCRPVTEVPRVPVFVAGIIAVRGVVMPVIDLRVRLRLPAAALSAKARILVVTRPGEAREPESREPHGLIVDRVHQVVRLGENDIEPATMLSGAEAEFIAGIGRLPLDGGADLRAARRGEELDDALGGARPRHQELALAGPGQLGEAVVVDDDKLVPIPAEVPYRPEAKTPRPRILGAQTATVVGPTHTGSGAPATGKPDQARKERQKPRIAQGKTTPHECGDVDAEQDMRS